jgi:hypothetical protein
MKIKIKNKEIDLISDVLASRKTYVEKSIIEDVLQKYIIKTREARIASVAKTILQACADD